MDVGRRLASGWIRHTPTSRGHAFPKVIYEHPTTRFVSSFIGQTNLFRGEIQPDTARDGLVEVLTELGIGLRLLMDDPGKEGKRCHAVLV
jgi:ABC-type Fe3+/spermidine/putrescine transport system ATPase subunit